MNLKQICFVTLSVVCLFIPLSGCGLKPDPEQLNARLTLAIWQKRPDQMELILNQMNESIRQQAVNDGLFQTMRFVGNEENTIAIFQTLLEYGADINCQEDNMNTVAHIGLDFGGQMTPAMLEWFIRNGYDINLKNDTGQTALSLCVDYARHFNHDQRHQMIRILLDNGADTHVTCRGKTPLLEPPVIWSGQNPNAKEQIQWLVDAGSDLETKNSSGHTVLLTAIEYGNEEMAEYLLELGADYEAADQYGTSVLFKSANMEFVKCVEMLISLGADVNKVSSGGYTPLHFAVAGGNEEIIKMLLDNGALINVVNKEGMTALDKADQITTCDPTIDTDTKRAQIIEMLIHHGAKRANQLQETNA